MVLVVQKACGVPASVLESKDTLPVSLTELMGSRPLEESLRTTQASSYSLFCSLWLCQPVGSWALVLGQVPSNL